MRLTVLGSGTAVPLLDRNNSGYVLEAGTFKFLLDSGAGTIRRLLETKHSLFDIHQIFYSHLHNDHINDLGAILWSNNYGGIRRKALNLYGPKGFRSYYSILAKRLLKPSKFNFEINAAELGNSMLKIGNVTVKSFRTRHSQSTKSSAYLFEFRGQSFVYAGDAVYCSEIVKAAKDADYLLIECSFPDYKKAEGHLTPALVGSIASEANVKTLILTHFYPDALKAPVKKQCSKVFSGKIVLARDKMRINL